MQAAATAAAGVDTALMRAIVAGAGATEIGEAARRGRAVGCEFAMRDVGRKPAAVAAEAINSAAAIARISGFCWSSPDPGSCDRSIQFQTDRQFWFEEF